MEDEVRLRQGWMNLRPFNWTERLSPRQVFDAANKVPLLFPKAAKILLLCEIAATRHGVQPKRIYERMRVEPAVYRIVDFNRTTLNQAQSERADILRILTRDCKQENRAVFFDLADGKTVSHRLASNTRVVLLREVPRLPIGDVIVGSGRQYRHTSVAETVDGLSAPLDEREDTVEGPEPKING